MQVLLAWGMAAILFELVLGILVGKGLARGARGASHEAPASSAVLAVAGRHLG
jgi:hypothetical protein